MNAAVAQERWQGQIIEGKFPLLEWLGGSANTSVFCTQLPTGQAAAIKLIRAESATAAQQIACWKDSALLSHSHLLRIFHSGHCQITGARWLYVVTELAEENLDQVLPVRPLSSAEVREMLPPVVEVLQFLHAKELVHGGIKPSNILALNNQLKLAIDSVQPQNQKSRDHALNAYDAPEAESGVLSGASDVWSLGMMLITAFNQRPVTWSRTSRQDPAVPKSVPTPYSQIAAECLRINPEQRCSLERIKENLERGTLSAKPVPVPKPAKAAKAKPKWGVVAAIAALIVIVAIIAFSVRHSSTRSSQQTAATIEQANQSAPLSTTETRTDETVSDAGPSAADGIVTRVTPQVPLSARETIHGKVKVKVRVSVNSAGAVSSAALVSLGPSRYFARLALESSQKWKFTPASSETNRQWTLEYKFGRSSTDVTSSEVH